MKKKSKNQKTRHSKPKTNPLTHAPLLPTHPPATLPTRREGEALGLVDGREVGFAKGFEVGQEMGFYAGCHSVWVRLALFIGTLGLALFT
jgi:hypothetical protein